MLKYEFKLVNSLITEKEGKNVQLILKVLKKQFYRYLEEIFEESIKQGHLREVIEENFNILLDNTDRNFIVILWLGIVDIRKLIGFMIDEEDKKSQIRQLDN
jgi:hypothetical protein